MMGFVINTADSVATGRGTGFGIYPYNSLIGHTLRGGSNGTHAYAESQLQLPAGTYALPAALVTGCVLVTNQYGFITEVTTLTNMTGVYTDAYDGTVAVPLNDTGGINLSGASVGSFLSTTGGPAEDATLLDADQVRVLFPDRKSPGNPFTINSKYGITTQLRLHFTTTDDPVDFKLFMNFEYQLLSSDATFSFA
jgi:hypothetical protein